MKKTFYFSLLLGALTVIAKILACNYFQLKEGRALTTKEADSIANAVKKDIATESSILMERHSLNSNYEQ